MPVPLSIDHPTTVQIRTVFGSAVGTIAVKTPTLVVEAPVAFGAIRPVGDYQILLDQAVAQLLPKGAVVDAIASPTGIGAFNELPVVEVLIGTSGETVSEHLIRQGWAVPDEAIFRLGTRGDEYVAALRAARAAHAGIWGEAGVTAASLGLSRELDQQTAPPAATPALVSQLSMLAVLVMAILLGTRERHWRMRQQSAAPTKRPRLWWRLVGAQLGMYHGQWKPVTPSAADPAQGASDA